MSNEDFEDEDLDMGENSFDDFGEEKTPGTLGDLVRNNSMVKIGLVIVGVVVIFGAIIFFGEEQQAEAPSVVSAGRGSEVNAPPGTQEASPKYIEAIEEENEERIMEAVRTGESALPTPIDPPVGRVVVPEEAEEAEDPLQRWRRLQEERLARELKRTQTIRPEDATAQAALIQETEARRAEAIKALSSAMSEQMQVVLESRRDARISNTTLNNVNYLEQLEEKRKAEKEETAAAEAPVLPPSDPRLLANAGEIVYAQTLIEANSDVPGPVLAQILSGRLKGSRAIGSFQVQDEYLTLTFGTVVQDETLYQVDAIALDPETTLQGLATEVDHRYFQRIVLPAAAAFVEGVADAIEESGRTTVTIQGETVAEETDEADSKQEVAAGVSELGAELGDTLDELSNVPILIRIEAGTPFAMLFLDQVIEENSQSANNNQSLGTQSP